VQRAAKRRAVWLGINLLTAFLASWVIGNFEAVIAQVVAVAVLMPIVASMGGIAGTQVLTLMVRALALGQVGFSNSLPLLRKEILVAVVNGVLWALVVGGTAFAVYRNTWLAVAFGTAMIINLLAAALAGVAIPLVLSRVPESFGPAARLDLRGLVLVTGAAIAIVWGLMRGNQVGWTNAEILASLLTGVVLGVAFVGWELRASEPMVPMRLFYARAFASGIVASFLFYASMYGVVFFLPQFFQAGQGFGPFDSGLRLLPWTATLFVFAPIGGSLVNRLGERPLDRGFSHRSRERGVGQRVLQRGIRHRCLERRFRHRLHERRIRQGLGERGRR
jgi:hypothetical protein